MHLAEAEHLQNNAFEFKSGIYRTERANLGQTEIFWLSYYVKKCTSVNTRSGTAPNTNEIFLKSTLNIIFGVLLGNIP